MSLTEKSTTPYAVMSKDIDLISYSRPASPPTGKNVAITFHIANTVLPLIQGTTLPTHIAVGINNKHFDADALPGLVPSQSSVMWLMTISLAVRFFIVLGFSRDCRKNSRWKLIRWNARKAVRVPSLARHASSASR